MAKLVRLPAVLAAALVTAALVAFPLVQSSAGSPKPAFRTGDESSTPGQGTPRTTALKMSVIGRPGHVLGTDGNVHFEYDLVATNIFEVPVTLTQVEVRADDGTQLLSLTGDRLQAVTQPLGEQPPAVTPTRVVASSSSVATLVDVMVPPGRLPEHVTNRVTYELPPDTPPILRALIGSLVIEGPSLSVDNRQSMVIASPLSGPGWFNGNGCCQVTLHRSFRITVDGQRVVTPETFAIDWVKEQGRSLCQADCTTNEQYFAYGAEVLSAIDGEVVAVRDGQPEETPMLDPIHVLHPEDFGGNSVAVRTASGVYAYYAHLQPGSIQVRVGDRVRTGQPLGALGNSGNSTQPHLHFELMDGLDPLTANSLPFVIDRYTLAGTVDEANSTATSLRIVGTPSRQEKTHPLFLSVSDFR
ncbi:M23 family metallopeptidase [Geodermatophilus sp. URMC 61]|uniref:M23 family metallopeptidase n=1 Tax=Geodermatophilus sp. URMC 61 TaxID=3423411 RepID=UPI00406CA4F4